MIELINISKRYNDHCAIKDINFSIDVGEVVGFLGPNGAGKSTTMNIISGYVCATNGIVLINDVETREKSYESKSMIGYLPEQVPLYQDLTTKEYLSYICKLKGIFKGANKHIDEISERVGIVDAKDRLLKNLSKGYKQRVGIAQALVNYPPILLLDEPTSGLDPKQIVEIRNLVKYLSTDHTIILSSHILSEVQSICKRIIIINEGEIVADGSVETLSNKFINKQRYLVSISGEAEAVLDELRLIPKVEQVSVIARSDHNVVEYEIITSPGVEIRYDLFSMLAQKNHPILELSRPTLNLEDMFMKLTANDTESTIFL